MRESMIPDKNQGKSKDYQHRNDAWGQMLIIFFTSRRKKFITVAKTRLLTGGIFSSEREKK